MIVPDMKNVLTFPKCLFIRIKYGKTSSCRKLETQQINNILKNLNILVKQKQKIHFTKIVISLAGRQSFKNSFNIKTFRIILFLGRD